MRGGHPRVTHTATCGTIQPKLIVTGKKPDVDGLLGLIGPPAGFELQHDATIGTPTSGEVTVRRSVLNPPSFVLAAELLTVIADPAQNAEVHVGPGQPGMRFGEFPDLDVNMIQKIAIDDLLRLEQGAPGSGVALAIHEIVENYVAHGQQAQQILKDFGKREVFSLAHEAAMNVEALVAGELLEPGRRGRSGQRVADFPVSINPQTIRWIADYETYFLVWDEVTDPKSSRSNVANARKTSREKVATFTIEGFGRGSDSVPAAASATISAVVATLNDPANQFATARLEGFADIRGSAERNVRLSELRAARVAEMVLQANIWGRWRRLAIVGSGGIGTAAPGETEADLGRNRRVVITVDRPFLP